MLTIERFEARNGYLYAEVAGQCDMRQFIAIQQKAMALCKEHALTKILLDTRRVTGPFLSVVDRFRMATEVEKFWDRRILLAVLSIDEQIAPDRMGIVSATNRGIQANVFTQEADAQEWLLRG